MRRNSAGEEIAAWPMRTRSSAVGRMPPKKAQQLQNHRVLECYRICARCFELWVTDGRCDPLVVYWNHKSNTLDGWRT